jgi:hypothetical protein
MADDRRQGSRDRNGSDSISTGRYRRRSKRQHTVDRRRHAVVGVRGRRDIQGRRRRSFRVQLSVVDRQTVRNGRFTCHLTAESVDNEGRI